MWIVVIVTNTQMHVFGQWTSDKGASFFNNHTSVLGKFGIFVKIIGLRKIFSVLFAQLNNSKNINVPFTICV